MATDVLADVSGGAREHAIEIEEGDVETLGEKSADRTLARSAGANQSNLHGSAHVSSNDIPLAPLSGLGRQRRI
jgi:hypothetical protein